MAGFATPQQPQYSSMTPVQRPQTSSETLRSNYYANIQAVGSQSAGQTMPALGHMDYGYSMVSPPYGNTHAASMQLAMNTSFDSTQMRTPPPTRGTSAKNPHQAQQIAFGTPSTIASRRFMTPQQPLVPSNSAQPGLSTPVQFPQLQFSPDVYQFTNLGPASAPVMPQSRVLWSQSGGPVQSMPQATLDDPFAPASSNSLGWSPAIAQQSNPQTVSFDTPAMDSFPIQAPQPRPASTVPLASNHAALSHNEPGSAGVDPSLLYSSPARPVARSSSRSKKARNQPPANGAQTKGSKTAIHSRSDTVSSNDTATSRGTTQLQRSNTTGTARPKSAQLSMTATESLSRSNSISQIPRTSSPAKRFGRPSLGSISESRPRQRTSVILTVDENGRARTETRRVDDSPTRSIRERYPALFDSDSSDTASDTSEQTPSRPSSFIFDKRDERRSKAAKLDPPVENLEGLSIPRSGSSASMKKGIPPSRAAVAAAAQLRRQSSLRRSTPSRNQNRRSLMSSSSTSLIDTCPMDVSTSQSQPQTTDGIDQPAYQPAEDQGVMNWADPRDTFAASSSNAESALEEHNRRWSIMSFEQQQQPQAILPQQQQYQVAAFPNPGMQVQHHSQGTHSRPLLIRCVCGVGNESGQRLIQCQSCTQWLHTHCVGLDSQFLPPTFTCFLCTRPPSSAGNTGAFRR